MAQRGIGAFVLGGPEHGRSHSAVGVNHGQTIRFYRRITTGEAMQVHYDASDEPVATDSNTVEYRYHKLGFGPSWSWVLLPSWVKPDDAMFYIIDLARGDEWGAGRSAQ